MHARHDPVELLEQLVVVVERAVGEHVHLGARQQREALELHAAHALDLAQQLVGRHVVAEAVAGRVVGDRDVLVAALAGRLGHLLDRVAAVRGDRVHVQVAADVAELDQLRQLALAGGRQLAAVLAQLGRDVLHPEPLVDLLLGREGVGLAALVVGDAVLAHVQAAPDRLGAQRLVVLARPGEVLEQVAERLLGHHAQVHRDARSG